jgi:hypothetical protein
LILILQAERFATYWPLNKQGAGLIMLTSSIIAVLYNLAHQKMIQTVSAVATTVLGSIKIVCLLILSATLLGKSFLLALRVAQALTLAPSDLDLLKLCSLPAPSSARSAGEGREFTLRMWLGCLLALAGFGAYSHSKLNAIRQGSGTETSAHLETLVKPGRL